MLQNLQKFIEYLDRWQNQKDAKMEEMKRRMEVELNNEKRLQKEAHVSEKNRRKIIYDKLPGPKSKFSFPKFKQDENKLKKIREKYAPETKQIKETFLSDSTSQGLRLTCKSTIELSKYLLNDCGFQYVLTRKFNQDWLEVTKIFSFEKYFLSTLKN